MLATNVLFAESSLESLLTLPHNEAPALMYRHIHCFHWSCYLTDSSLRLLSHKSRKKRVLRHLPVAIAEGRFQVHVNYLASHTHI